MLPEAGFNFVLGTIQTINASRESKLPMIIFWNLANEASNLYLDLEYQPGVES
jgi:hypothetical protein